MFLFLGLLALAGCSDVQTNLSPSPTVPTTTPTPTVPPPLSLYFSALAPIGPLAATPSAPLPSTVSALDAGSGALRWASTIGAQVQNVPVVDQETLYVGANDQKVYALNAGDGHVRWKASISGQPHVITLQDGVLYGDIDQNTGTHFTRGPIFALNASNGSIKWLSSISASFYGLVDNVIYAATADNQLYALDAAHGSVRWQFQMAAPFGGLKVAQGQVYVLSAKRSAGTPSVVLDVLNANTGVLQWRYPTDPKDLETLSLVDAANGAVYLVSSQQQNLATTPVALALNATDGSLLWHYQVTAPATSFTASTSDETSIYLGTDNGQLIALNAADGTQHWQANVATSLLNIDLIDSGAMYITVSGEGIIALNLSSGAVLWRYQSPDYVSISSAKDGTLYGYSLSSSFGADSHNYILALKASLGTLLWHYDTGTSSIFPVLN